MDEKPDIVTLIDEEGEEFEFEVVDYFFADGQEYAVLLPIHSEFTDLINEDELIPIEDDDFDEDDDTWVSEEAIIMRVTKGDNGEATLQIIEDEDEWQRVADMALERLFDQKEE